MVVSVVVLLALSALVVTTLSRHRSSLDEPSSAPASSGDASTTPATPPAGVSRALAEELERWRAQGLLSAQQVGAIAAFEAARAPQRVARAPRRVPAVAEAIGYIGAILAVVGVVLITVRYWPHLATAARLGLSGALSVLLGAGGALIHEAKDAAYARLRAALWLASTASAALFAVVAVRSIHGGDQRAELAVLFAGLVVAALSAVMWRGRFRPIQEMTTLGGGVVAVSAGVRLIATPGWMGFAAWACGAALIAIALMRKVRTPYVADLVGAASVVVGSVIMMNFMTRGGPLLAAASALGLFAHAAEATVARDDVEVRFYAIMGAITLVMTWPSTIQHYAQGAGLLTGAVVWLLGALALGAAMRTTVRGPLLVEWGAGLALLGGAAITAAQFASLAPLLGLVTAFGLLYLGTRPGEVMLSFVGSVGLLVNVPWLIVRIFPGQVRAPVVILITGALFVALAVLMSRERGRLHDALSGHARRVHVRH
ncbi:MAG: DUF2157 domain-containing protein [Acidobacteriota bacterium]|nr:DUF2157 domain-containing protein [Acidobacteriota bacterium]